MSWFGDSPAKVLPSSDHRVVDLDVFLEKQSTDSSLKTPAPQKRASKLLGAHPRVDIGHGFIYQVSATRPTKHKRNSVARSRSIKRISSQKRFESSQSALKGDTRVPSMERLLEILATIISRAPEHWVPSHMIDVFIQSQGHSIQELIEKLPTKTSQYIMFLVLKIASTWVETSSALKATKISSPTYTSTSDLIDENNHLSQGFAASVDLEALRLEARNTVAKKLAAHVFLRPLQVEVSTPSPQVSEYPHSQGSYSEVDAIAAFEILLLSYENLGRQRKKSKDTAEFEKSSKYPRKSSLSALKRNPTLTPDDIPSLPLPPWRKMARNKVDSENTDNYKELISEAKTLLIQHESQARVIPSGGLESPLSANQEVEPLNSSDMSSSSQYNSGEDS
ncbi:hypothetical protein BGZ49_003478 [Haplosporangium sp. Z 27]|nr:hypothetical protein BGZ49_003478 [Haplosporangium sp. Z 27]